MSGGSRPERVAEEFREILAEEIPRLKDPRVGFVTVTRVEVSPDLRRATVYYTVLGQDQVRMKFTPDLEFEEDVGLAQVERVTELLREIGAQRTVEEPGEPGGGEEEGE